MSRINSKRTSSGMSAWRSLNENERSSKVSLACIWILLVGAKLAPVNATAQDVARVSEAKSLLEAVEAGRFALQSYDVLIVQEELSDRLAAGVTEQTYRRRIAFDAATGNGVYLEFSETRQVDPPVGQPGIRNLTADRTPQDNSAPLDEHLHEHLQRRIRGWISTDGREVLSRVFPKQAGVLERSFAEHCLATRIPDPRCIGVYLLDQHPQPWVSNRAEALHGVAAHLVALRESPAGAMVVARFPASDAQPFFVPETRLTIDPHRFVMVEQRLGVFDASKNRNFDDYYAATTDYGEVDGIHVPVRYFAETTASGARDASGQRTRGQRIIDVRLYWLAVNPESGLQMPDATVLNDVANVLKMTDPDLVVPRVVAGPSTSGE